MKINKLALMMLALSTSVLAEQKLNNITLDRVTLFLEGAELHGKTDVTLVKGENDIIVSGVSNVINPDSMTIGFENMPEIKILSVKTRDPMNVITDESDLALYGESDNQGVIDEIKSLRTKKKELETEYQATEIEFAAVSETIALLQGNHIDNLIKNSPNMVADMKSVLDFVKSNLTSALNEQAALQAKLEDLNAQVGEYQSQIEQKAHKVNTTARADNRIALKVYSDKDITVPLSLSYTIDNAGWTPDYDLHVTDINSPLQLTYKAYVYQNSGLDWHDINFTLSTATLNKTESAPDLASWRIDIPNKSKNSSKRSSSTSDKAESDPVQDESAFQNEHDDLNLARTGINLAYKLDLPYTLKSNSDNNQLTIQSKDINAEYLYVATPKLDDSFYLQAFIPDWTKLDLLPGSATLFFANNYIGKHYIQSDNQLDKLPIMLGRDKTISVTRNRDLNEVATQSGNKISQKYGYTITVKNSKSLPIDIIINDQLPVIQNQAIVMDDAKYEGASYDKESGLLSWRLTLQPEETKDIHFSFKLTYPKDKADLITGL